MANIDENPFTLGTPSDGQPGDSGQDAPDLNLLNVYGGTTSTFEDELRHSADQISDNFVPLTAVSVGLWTGSRLGYAAVTNSLPERGFQLLNRAGQMSGGLLAGEGIWEGISDYYRLRDATTPAMQFKYGTGLGEDAAKIAGGTMMMLGKTELGFAMWSFGTAAKLATEFFLPGDKSQQE